MIAFEEALALLAADARPLGKERIAIAEAHRRVLAAPVAAAVDSPPSDVSAMDGYALRGSDLDEGRKQFRVVGESFPAAPFSGAVPAGGCVRIFTGAPVPAGLDRVVIQENVRRQGDLAAVAESPSPARHIRLRGSDFRTGDLLLEPGRLLGPRALVAAAGGDIPEVEVWRRPQLALLGTGDELAAPGEARRTPGRIAESLSVGIAAMAAEWGAEPVGSQRIGDDPAAIEAAAGAALERADLLVMTGGASVGEKDFAKAALAAHGLDLIFSKVAIKPGKPVWFGRAKGRWVLGLPGNPTSALVTARLLLAPLIAGLTGRDPSEMLRWRRVALAAPVSATGDRETFHRGRWRGGAAESLESQDSGAQKALVDAELLIRRDAGAPRAEAGALVDVLDF